MVLFVGIVWLLSNLGVIQFYWGGIWRYWPVFLIIIGINILVPKNTVGNIISVLITIIALVFIGYQASLPTASSFGSELGWFNDDDSDAENTVSNNSFSAPYDDQIKEVDLRISGGAVEYKLTGNSTELFDAKASGMATRHSLSTKRVEDKATVNFDLKSQKGNLEWGKGKRNRAAIALNSKPDWNIKLELGAGTADLDLSTLRISGLNFSGGASTFKVKLGMPNQKVAIHADAGAATVNIQIPKDATCKITADTGLSAKDFPGFVKDAEGNFVTPGFEENENAYMINLSGGLATFKVRRY